MSDTIQIEIDGPKLTPDRFIKAAQAFLDLVTGVSKNLSDKATPEEWTVETEKGSVIVRMRTDNPERAAAIHAVGRGVRALNSGVRAVPEWFTKDEVKAARELTAVIDAGGKFVTSISMANGEVIADLSPITIKTADAILSGEKYEAFGSIEGRIETLHGREAYPLAFYVSDVHSKRQVVCHFNKTEDEEGAIGAFRKRVLVYGLIHYAKEGYPTSVDADSLRIFAEEGDLPSVEQVQAIYR